MLDESDEDYINLNDEADDILFEIADDYEIDDDITSLVDSFDFHVTYKFTDEIRSNIFASKKYGEANMSFKELYYMLCTFYNKGHLFIDDYFETVYPYTMKEDVDAFLEVLKDEITSEYDAMLEQSVYTKKGKLDKRYKKNLRKLAEFRAFSSARVREEGRYLTELVREDIISCLSAGVIPLHPNVLSDETIRKRMSVGLPREPKFFASGQLINNIVLCFRLEKKEWETNLGSMV